jgi:hypothetical protein
MFTKRTIKPHTVVTSVDTASEALAVSIGEKACVDLDYMAGLTWLSQDDLIGELEGVIFLNPSNKRYETADEYLSGNVREKLRIVRGLADNDPIYTSNVTALEAVQPQNLTAGEIDVRLGATWLPQEDIEQFVLEFLKPSYYAKGKIKVHYSPYTASWSIEGKKADYDGVLANVTYGTDRINAYQIIEQTLNLKDVRIFDKKIDADGKEIRVLNRQETTVAQQKQQQIKDAFQEWIWNDHDRRERLVRLYQATKDERYLKQAERMAGFMKPYDKLPVEHSHGSLGEYHGLMLLHEVTGKPEYLNRAVARWEEAVKGGYVWPTGGVGEMFMVAFRRDEGCSECDWLRVNLDLWQATGNTRYLDMAERLLLNHYAMNQTPNGGFGHHEFVLDNDGPLLMQPQFTEAVWCCTFHGLMGLNTLKKYVITSSDQGIYVNFPMDAEAKVKVGKETWNVKTEASAKAGVMKLIVNVKPAEAGSKTKAPKLYVRVPEWASDGKAAGYKTIGNADGYMILSDAESSNESAQFTFAYAPRLEG